MERERERERERHVGDEEEKKGSSNLRENETTGPPAEQKIASPSPCVR